MIAKLIKIRKFKITKKKNIDLKKKMIDETYKDLAILLLILISIGSFGNVMNIIIFNKKTLKKNSTFNFLFYQSIIDLLVLSICASDTVMTYGFNLEVRLLSKFTCKIHTFLTYFLTQLSSTIIMFVSIERVLVVCNFKFLSSTNSRFIFFKSKRIEKLILMIALFLCLVNIHYLFFFRLNMFNGNLNNQNGLNDMNSSIKILKSEISKYVDKNPAVYQTVNLSLNFNEKIDGYYYVCYSFNHKNYLYFMSYIWVFIDNSIYSLIPIIIMTICSSIIILHIREKSKRFFKISSAINKQLIVKRTKRNKKILYMLIVTNFFFIVCSLPYCVMSFQASRSNTNTRFSQPLLMAHIMSYSNNSFNFLSYIIFIKQYRDFALKILGLKVNEDLLIREMHIVNNKHRILSRRSVNRSKHSRKDAVKLVEMTSNSNHS